MRLNLMTTGGPDSARVVLRWFQKALGWQVAEKVGRVSGGIRGSGLVTGEVHRGSVADGAGTVVNVMSFNSVSRVRSMIGKPDLCRLVSVDADATCDRESCEKARDFVSSSNASSNSPSSTDKIDTAPSLTNSDLFRLSFGNTATVVPHLRYQATDNDAYSSLIASSRLSSPPASLRHEVSRFSRDNLESTYALKELAIGCSSSYETMFDYAYDAFPVSSRFFPGLFRISEDESGGTCTVRLLPSQVSTLIFRVPSLESALERQEIEKSVSGKIGFRANKTGQLLLSPPFAGLDLRLCESLSSDQSFDEGNEVLMQNVLKGIGDTAHTSQLNCGSVMRKEFVGLAKKDRL